VGRSNRSGTTNQYNTYGHSQSGRSLLGYSRATHVLNPGPSPTTLPPGPAFDHPSHFSSFVGSLARGLALRRCDAAGVKEQLSTDIDSYALTPLFIHTIFCV
ncbi:MAG TPA: hypothetical protein PKM35_14875, partial [Holophaga sp.]|nr:hypothetical protein [Holophaga sp.]